MSDYAKLIEDIERDITGGAGSFSTREVGQLLAALKDTIARAERAEAERDHAQKKLDVFGTETVCLKRERDKWKELAREAASILGAVKRPYFVPGSDEWLAKLKKLEATKP